MMARLRFARFARLAGARLIAAMLGTIMLSGAASVRAEPVLIQAQNGTMGQGWMFRQPSGADCLVVTAAHVVPGGEGLVVTRAGAVGQIAAMIRHPDNSIDMAVLRIEGRARTQCSAAQLGYPDAGPFIAEASRENRELVIEQIPPCSPERRDAGQCGGLYSQRVLIDSFDARRPVFAFAPAGGQQVMGGDSGSAILAPRDVGGSQAQPVGLVTHAGTGHADPGRAIMFHEVRRILPLLTPASPPAPTPAAGRKAAGGAPAPVRVAPARALRLGEFRAALADPGCGPLGALGQASCPFLATPLARSRTVDLVVVPTPVGPVTAIDFAFLPDRPLPSGVEVLVSDAEDAPISSASWLSVRYCRPDAAQFRCAVALAGPASILLRFAGPVGLQKVELTGVSR